MNSALGIELVRRPLRGGAEPGCKLAVVKVELQAGVAQLRRGEQLRGTWLGCLEVGFTLLVSHGNSSCRWEF